MMWWNDYWPAPWMAFGPVMMIVLALFCVGMMVLMMRGMTPRSRSPDAMDILKERFARGEISQSEYEDRRRLLHT